MRALSRHLIPLSMALACFAADRVGAQDAPQRTTVLLEADPAGSQVTVNAEGATRTYTTPIELELAPGVYELEFTAESWPTALEATVAGEYDVVGALWFREERGESLAFSEPYIDCEIALIKLATSDFRFSGRDSLVGRNVGVVDDYAYSREAVDRTGIEIVSGGTVAENVARLGSGEIDLVVADRRVALFHINEGARAKMFDVLPDPLMKRGLRIAVPKRRPDHEEIIAAFDIAVAEMRADGTYDALLASFRVSTW